MNRLLAPLVLLLTTAISVTASGEENRGYYRFPALADDAVVFTAEGDLWQVGLEGGAAQRLTSHQGLETHAAVSPDGRSIAFSADYEGPTEIYWMPREGGLPKRLTWEGESARAVGFTPAGEVLYATRFFSTLPQMQLAAVNPHTDAHRLLPLAQAAEGAFDAAGDRLVFTRFPFQGSYTKRYRGGTAQNLWRFHTNAKSEAVPLTADFDGTSREPMVWGERVVFVSDRDGNLDLWSMDWNGQDLRQHTRHEHWDVKSPSLWGDQVVYQLGADLYLHHLPSGEERLLPITLPSDFDQRRERWLDKPFESVNSAQPSPDGERVALTARGRVFVAPEGSGRLVRVSREEGVRYRAARFLDDDTLLALSDQSGEVELWTLDARGIEPPRQVTSGGSTLRFEAWPSPDGVHAAFIDRNDELWITELATGEIKKIAASSYFGFQGLAFSPDSRWLAYAMPQDNHLSRIWLYRLEDSAQFAVTSERFNSFEPSWSPDGGWLYFLSERNLESDARHPWGTHQPLPHLSRKMHLYLLDLAGGQRSPFAPEDELLDDEETENGTANGGSKEGGKKGKDDAKAVPEVKIERDGLARRLYQVPGAPGTYAQPRVSDKHVYWLESSGRGRSMLRALALDPEAEGPETVAEDLLAYELSADGKRLLLRKEKSLFLIDAKGKAPGKLSKNRLPLAGFSLRFDPRAEWRQMYTDAWRLLRDYFYDPGMHGVDWPAMHAKYLPLVDRITDRDELAALMGELTGELSTLHHYVNPGDTRRGQTQVVPASLGATFRRNEAAGGFVIERILSGDPDLPAEQSPLARPGVDLAPGDVLLTIDGIPTLSVPHPHQLLRDKSGHQTLLEIRPAEGGESRRVIVYPITPNAARNLRYGTWERERRERVEELGEGRIGYVHLRAMGGRNYEEWARNYFPVFNRLGLIVDVRQNRGGNIDSWILGNLVRRPWMWWQARSGIPYRNMQYAFGGHLVVLCDEFTRSDGEAFAEGFRRLGLGQVIGTRTWGGEIWLTSSNRLVDGGIATAAEFGVYGPESEWLIEGHGVVPDIEVDNLPHATFRGEDAQLEAAVSHLLKLLEQDPRPVPEPPPYPDKSWMPPGS